MIATAPTAFVAQSDPIRVRLKKFKTLLTLNAGKFQSNLNLFKQRDILRHTDGRSIINLLYLACLSITASVKQHIQCDNDGDFNSISPELLRAEKLHHMKQYYSDFFSSPDPICLHSCSRGILPSRVGLVLVLWSLFAPALSSTRRLELNSSTNCLYL